MTTEEVSALYISRAQELEKDGKYKEAERLMQSDEGLSTNSRLLSYYRHHHFQTKR